MFYYPRLPSYLTFETSEIESVHRSRSWTPKKRKKKDMPGRQVSINEPPQQSQIWQVVEVFVAEVVGTALLVFFVCMAQANFPPWDEIPSLRGAIVTAVVVATIVQIFGHISQAHINPSVTVAFLVLGRITPFMSVVYILAQVVGAFFGYALIVSLTPSDLVSSTPPGFCCTLPHPGLTGVQAVAVEFVATSLLVLVVCACLDPRNADKCDSVPLKFGCVLMTLGAAVGPYTGASMNPARSLAPAVWTGTWEHLWVYWMGPLLSGFCTALFYQALFLPDRQQHVQETSEFESLNHVKVSGARSHPKIEEETIR